METVYKVNFIDEKTGIIGRFSWFYNYNSKRLIKNIEEYLTNNADLNRPLGAKWNKTTNGYSIVLSNIYNRFLEYAVTIDTKNKIITVE